MKMPSAVDRVVGSPKMTKKVVGHRSLFVLIVSLLARAAYSCSLINLQLLGGSNYLVVRFNIVFTISLVVSPGATFVCVL